MKITAKISIHVTQRGSGGLVRSRNLPDKSLECLRAWRQHQSTSWKLARRNWQLWKECPSLNYLFPISDLQAVTTAATQCTHLIVILVDRGSTPHICDFLQSRVYNLRLEQSSGKFSASSPSRDKQKRTWMVRDPSLDAHEPVSGDPSSLLGQ